MSLKVHTERDPLLGINPWEIPPHLVAETIAEIVTEAHRLVGDVLTELIGFYAPAAHAHRPRTTSSNDLPAVHESLLREAIDENKVLDLELIPEPRQAFDPTRQIARSVLIVPLRAPDGSAIAAAYLANTERHAWTTAELTLLRSATRIAEADARLRIATALIEERENSTAALAEFGADLASIERLEEFGPTVARAVSRIAGPDAIAVVELHDNRVRLIASDGLSDRDAAHLAAIDVADRGPAGLCLTTAQATFYGSRPDFLEDHPSFGRLLGDRLYHAWAFVPIVSGGKALGAIVCHWRLPLDVREMHRSDLIEVGRIAGLALGRLRVQETGRQLAAIEAQLSASPSVENVIGVVADAVRHLLGAFTVHLGIVEGNTLRRVSSSGLAETKPHFEAVELPRASSVKASGRTMSQIFLTPGDDWTVYPALLSTRELLGAVAVLAQPIVGEGETIGFLTAAYLDERDCGPYERNRAQLVSVMLARAIHRASLFDRERKITHELQRSLLPEQLPHRDDYQIIARYIAADAGLEVGGDWFDAFPLRRGSLAIALGDIVGHGLKAAGAAGQLRSACRALAEVSTGPTNLVERLDEFCAHASGTQFATLLYGELDEHTGRLEFCRAGHVPPVLVLPDGEARIIEDRGSWVIGLGVGGPRVECDLMIPPGARLLFFTDGLIERRGENLDTGYQRLLQAVRQHHALSKDEFADALIAELAGEVNTDDRCLLVIERHKSVTI